MDDQVLRVREGMRTLSKRPIRRNADRDRLYFDIFVTAMESHQLGLWCTLDNDHYYATTSGGMEDDLYHFRADVLVHGESETRVINRQVIARGYILATVGYPDLGGWRGGPPPLNIGPDTDWLLYSYDACTIVELGLFGRTL